MNKRLKNIQTFEQHSSELNIYDVITSNINESKTNKDIEELLKTGSKVIALTKYEEDKEVKLIFYIDEETPENEITQQQFEEYMVLCDGSDTSDWYSNWKIGKSGRSYYWL
jgi:hypothetical protein